MALDLVQDVGTAVSSLQRKSSLDQLCSDLLGRQVADRAVLMLDLLLGLVDDVENRMRVQAGGKYILPVPDLQNLWPMSGLLNHFDRGILHGIDYAGDPRPGLELVCD